MLELGDGVFEVCSTAGDNHLGGDDWDQRIIDWLADKFQADNGIDIEPWHPSDDCTDIGK